MLADAPSLCATVAPVVLAMVRSVGQRLPVDCYSAWAESRQIRTKRIKLLLIGEKELYEKFYPFVNVHGF